VRLQVGAEHAEVQVRDSGAGLDAAMLAHLFEPFVQARPGAGGLGIGLPLSRALAELHGGTLEAASDGPGRGSTFTLRLPRGRAAPREAPPQGG
jgi:signal transduction histidine kinase